MNGNVTSTFFVSILLLFSATLKVKNEFAGSTLLYEADAIVASDAGKSVSPSLGYAERRKSG